MHLITTDLRYLKSLDEKNKVVQVAPAQYAPNSIQNTDAVDFLAGLPDNSVDVIFTDEPYGVASMTFFYPTRNVITTDFKWDKVEHLSDDLLNEMTVDNGKQDEIKLPMSAQIPWVAQAFRVLKEGGMLMNFGTAEFTGLFRDITIYYGFRWRGSGPWVKTNPPTHLRRNGFKSATEYFWFASKGETTKTINFLEQMEMNNYILESECPGCGASVPMIISKQYDKPRWIKTLGTNDFIGYMAGPLNSSRVVGHPTEKPLWLLWKLLTILGGKDPVGKVMVDPFCGSGGHLATAKRLGMTYYGNDKDIEWSTKARARMELESSSPLLGIE